MENYFLDEDISINWAFYFANGFQILEANKGYMTKIIQSLLQDHYN